MAQVPSLCVLYFLCGCFHCGRPSFSQAAVWAPLQSWGGQDREQRRSACVYKFLGQGEVTAVQAVVSKCWARDCSMSTLRNFFCVCVWGGGQTGEKGSGECRFLWCMHLRGRVMALILAKDLF